jgi:fibronectin-binding autotransporter adhesin
MNRFLTGQHFAIVLVFLCAPAFANNYWSPMGSTAKWDVTSGNSQIDDGTGTWATPNSNWTYEMGVKNSPFCQLCNAQIGGGATGAGGTITISGTQQVYNLTFKAPYSGGSYTLTGGTLKFPYASTISVNGSTTPTIASAISASNNLTISGDGTGTLNWTGTNSISGTTTVKTGTLNISGDLSSTKMYLGITYNGTTASSAGLIQLQSPNFTGKTIGIVTYSGTPITTGTAAYKIPLVTWSGTQTGTPSTSGLAGNQSIQLDGTTSTYYLNLCNTTQIYLTSTSAATWTNNTGCSNFTVEVIGGGGGGADNGSTPATSTNSAIGGAGGNNRLGSGGGAGGATSGSSGTAGTNGGGGGGG